MAFVCDSISDADWVKYRLEKRKRPSHGDAIGFEFDNNHWIIDRNREMYLRKMGAERIFGKKWKNGELRILRWHFYWHGELVKFEQHIIDYDPMPPYPLVSARLCNFSIPGPIKRLKKAMCKDLREAFFVRGIGYGLPEGTKKFTLRLGIEFETMNISLEFAQETDDRWIAEVPALPGVMAYGASREEAAHRALALALRCVADKVEHGEMFEAGSISFRLPDFYASLAVD